MDGREYVLFMAATFEPLTSAEARLRGFADTVILEWL